MSALARWCFRHRLLVVGIWAALLVALAVPYATLGTSYSDAFSLPGLESSKAQARLQTSEPRQAGDSDQIVVHVRHDGSVRDPAVRRKVTSMLDRVAALPSVASVTSVYGPDAAARISKDGRTGYATVTFDAQAERIPAADVTRVIDTARAVRDGDLRVELGGQAISLVAEGGDRAPRPSGCSPPASSSSSPSAHYWACSCPCWSRSPLSVPGCSPSG